MYKLNPNNVIHKGFYCQPNQHSLFDNKSILKQGIFNNSIRSILA